MTKDDCGNHGQDKLFRRIFACILALIIIVLFIIFVVWLVLRPHKPHLYLQDVSVFQFNVTGANLLTTSLQVTLVSQNRNDRIGIYYDRLRLYATYRNQQVTLAAYLPPTYEEHKGMDVWSPVLEAYSLPVSPSLALAMGQDQAVGYYIIGIKGNGKVRWRVGNWVSGHYHLHVYCSAYLRADSRTVNDKSTILRLLQPVGCSVDV